MKSQDMQVIGLCRFSYPAIGGFQVEHETLEERRAYLYSDKRMEERFRTFETITLPGLKAQTDQNFTFVIVIGECMPENYIERLFALIEGMPQALIVAKPPKAHRPVMQEIINAGIDQDSKLPSLQFRHDDDDAVSIDFVERLRAAAQDSIGLIKRSRTVGIDFNRGYSALPTSLGLQAEEVVLPSYGVALGMAVKAGVSQTIMNYAHKKLSQNMPTVTYTDTPMFVRGHNDFNDSRQKANIKPVELDLLVAEQETYFKERFAIDSDEIRKAFSSAG